MKSQWGFIWSRGWSQSSVTVMSQGHGEVTASHRCCSYFGTNVFVCSAEAVRVPRMHFNILRREMVSNTKPLFNGNRFLNKFLKHSLIQTQKIDKNTSSGTSLSLHVRCDIITALFLFSRGNSHRFHSACSGFISEHRFYNRASHKECRSVS